MERAGFLSTYYIPGMYSWLLTNPSPSPTEYVVLREKKALWVNSS